MYTVNDVIRHIEEFAPLSLQESWDNCGLIVGLPGQVVNKALLCVDVTEEVVMEAVEHRPQLIISHHPVILSGIKKITGSNDAQRAIMLAIKNDIAIYAAHTNLDHAPGGVSYRMARQLGLQDVKVLAAGVEPLYKLVTYIPLEYMEKVSTAIFEAGAGHIGKYDHCGFSVEGKGTFRPLEHTNPFVGKKGEIHVSDEKRFETIFPASMRKKIVGVLLQNHPYEEVAYDIYQLSNTYDGVGLGVTGTLPEAVSEQYFLQILKEKFFVPAIRHTNLCGRPVKKVALCGGSGSSLLNRAIQEKADVYVSADFKYHQFAEAEQRILIADIGHFESEQFAKEIFHEILTKKIPNFAVHFSKVKTNPINYL